MEKLRVLLADDHVVLREGLAALIDAQSDMEVIAQASDGRAALQQALDCQPDVVVIDLSMPGMRGPQAAAQMTQACPNMRIVALTRHSEQGYVRQMLQAGARGYVLKNAAAAELIDAIRTVAAGKTYLDAALSDRVVNDYVRTQADGDNAAVSELSGREADVVRLTALGYSNKEIASQLGISIKTVDTYKMRAMEKLDLRSRAALVRYAAQLGWLDQL